MAKKKKVSKKVKAKNVDTRNKGQSSVTKEVLIDGPADKEQVTAPSAFVEEPTMKVVERGQATFYTKSEYDKKFGKK